MKPTFVIMALAAAAAVAAPAPGASHLWRIKEIFSTPDGSVQFIELKECCGGPAENFMQGKWIKSLATNHQYNFPANVPGNTANKHLLLGTAAFAALPGAPTPDFIIPAGFFNPADDFLEYYVYESDFNFPAGALPTDGLHALVCSTPGAVSCASFSVAVNSPTNYKGETGQITVPCDPADLDLNGAVDVQDLVAMILAWGPNPGSAADLNDDGEVNVQDMVDLVLAWGPC
jgi:hypothetical protein